MNERSRRGSDLPFLLAVVVGGLALRLIWLARIHGIDSLLDAAEASHAAMAFAQSGRIADAYFTGQGPTAHLLPVNVAVAGTILRVLAPGSTAANAVLLAWSLGQVGAAYLILRALFRELGSSPTTLRWGLALLCLVTPFVPQETVDFRYWEGGSALALGSLNLLLAARLERTGQLAPAAMSGVALLSALTLFVSPPVGMAVDLCWAWVALRRLPFRRAAALAAAAAAALALFIAPWAMRNERLLGAPVLLRSNAGLELALANHPAALSQKPPERVFFDRLNAIHPAASPRARAAVGRPGGEVAWSRRLGAEAREWIIAHPIDFARLYLRHLRQFLFPQAWQMYFTGWEGMRAERAWAITLVDLLGLGGLALALRQGRRRYRLLALYLAALALPYALFQPMARYIYLAWGMLAFLAVDFLVSIARGGMPGRVGPAGHPIAQPDATRSACRPSA